MRTNARKKQSKRRKLFLSLLMIAFLGVLLTTSTYAWFTANKTVTVNSINVNVAASEGLQVSVDAINWKTIISNSDITGAQTTYPTATNQLPSELSSLSPISTIGDIDSSNGFMKMFAGEIDSNDEGSLILTAKQNKETHGTSGKFIAFDLYFQVNTVTPIYLSSNSNVVAKNNSTGIENAGRVAFVIEGNVPAGTGATEIQQKFTTSGGSSVVYFWEPNYDVHTASAIANAKSNYSGYTGVDDLTGTGDERLEYYGVKADIERDDDIPLNSKDSTYFSKVDPQITSVQSGIPSGAYVSAFTLQPGITKVRVYMWVEGQDVDCENNASGGSLTYNLQFTSNQNNG